MIKIITVAILLSLLTACIPGTPMYNARQTAQKTPSQLVMADDRELCNALYFEKTNTNIFDEINQRRLLRESDWELVRQKKITIGMSLCALRASWGPVLREHQHTNSNGTTLQRVYGTYGSHNYNYVHLRDGVVVSISD